MEIRYLKQNEINITKWDKCIAGSINGIVYAYSWYLDIVCETWNALVYGDYETVMPLTYNKKYGISYLYQPQFSQQLGIFSSRNLSGEIVGNFIKSIPEKFSFIEINLNKFNSINDVNNIKLKQNVTYELELIRDYESLFRQYKKNTIRNIRKAIQNKISITHGLKPNDVVALLNSTGNKQAYTEKDFTIVRRLIVGAIRNNSGQLFGAYTENNNLCAVGFFIYSNKKACFILSVANDEAKKTSAMFLLIDEFIKQYASKNMILDFEGSNIEGIARFYAGFGARPFNYPSIKINKLFYPLRLIKR
ncbi:MAG: hypothetical protein B6I20_05375 [Bacteroidetes bacterium 4572_117]|nr:MAG: hypothetical protein B6I20_05375 [Bacteroidetes bacterium 4572_117]